ncbi:MAG: glycosyltransferase [Gammaproteobacteria bacterium]|nr:MAG: glycosyltransferase [Gammaproteobacteria bacterium]
MLISVVFSFRNEEKVIPELVRRASAVLEDLGEHELIFVNDASTDGSLEILQSLRAANNNIKIISMSRRFGVTPCVIAGLAEARGDAVVYMDADLQDPPELIPDLVRKWHEGVEVVHTVRTKRYGESLMKMWLTMLAYKMINAFSDIDFYENAGDFKLLSRRAVTEILKLNEHDPYLRGLSRWIGFRQAMVHYERDARAAGESKFGLFKSTNPYKEFNRGITSFSAAPLYFALILGLVVALISFLALAYVILTKLMGINLPGWTAIMATILFLSGVILFTIGILGVYLGRIYEQVKGRPSYIIDRKIGFD